MASSTTVDRGTRRRARTRSQLVAAAKALFAEQGVDATRIQEITDRADVGFGSFYNHFDDKDAIVEAVVRELTDTQASLVAEVAVDVDDPAEVVAIAHRHFLRLAESDPVWGWLLIRLDVSHRAFTETVGSRAAHDLKRGMDAGRFEVTDFRLTLNATGGALLGTTRAILEGNAGPDAGEHHAELVLRMLGVPTGEAAEISRRPLPL